MSEKNNQDLTASDVAEDRYSIKVGETELDVQLDRIEVIDLDGPNRYEASFNVRKVPLGSNKQSRGFHHIIDSTKINHRWIEGDDYLTRVLEKAEHFFNKKSHETKLKNEIQKEITQKLVNERKSERQIRYLHASDKKPPVTFFMSLKRDEDMDIRVGLWNNVENVFKFPAYLDRFFYDKMVNVSFKVANSGGSSHKLVKLKGYRSDPFDAEKAFPGVVLLDRTLRWGNWYSFNAPYKEMKYLMASVYTVISQIDIKTIDE